jgi:hypothetical protein
MKAEKNRSGWTGVAKDLRVIIVIMLIIRMFKRLCKNVFDTEYGQKCRKSM